MSRPAVFVYLGGVVVKIDIIGIINFYRLLCVSYENITLIVMNTTTQGGF